MNITKIPRGRLKVKVIIIVLTIPLVLGLSYLRYAMSHESTDDAFVTGHIVSVSARVDGHVEKVYVNDNQSVEQGDLLAEIDTRDYKVSLDLASAAMSAAQASAEQNRAQVGIASVEAARAEKDYNRYRQLFEANGGVTQQQVDNAAAAAQSAAAQLEAANKQVVAAQAKASEAKSAFDRAQLNLSYTRIYTPQSGRVTNKALEAGEYIRVGQPLMMIVPREVWVVANFKETQLKYMKPGQKVQIKVDAYPQKIFKGHIDSIQAGTGAIFSLLPPENATGNYVKIVQRVPVKIVFDEDPNNTRMLSPGMSVVPVVKVK
ncbi:MAG: HlyD family secretion protein [Sedimentisphaerales bacterium]